MEAGPEVSCFLCCKKGAWTRGLQRCIERRTDLNSSFCKI